MEWDELFSLENFRVGRKRETNMLDKADCLEVFRLNQVFQPVKTCAQLWQQAMGDLVPSVVHGGVLNLMGAYGPDCCRSRVSGLLGYPKQGNSGVVVASGQAKAACPDGVFDHFVNTDRLFRPHECPF